MRGAGRGNFSRKRARCPFPRGLRVLFELKAHHEVVGIAHQPLVITQNGKAAGVLLSPGEFDRLTERARFVSAVNEGSPTRMRGIFGTMRRWWPACVPERSGAEVDESPAG